VSVIGAAAEWVMSAASGPAVTAIMTIAVAAFAVSMLFGRLAIRQGFRLVLGCFVLAGSAEIAVSLTGAMARTGVAEALPDPAVFKAASLPPLGPDVAPSPPTGDPFDPYSGGKTVR
jgi:type IV secretion system protein VirB2